MDSLCARLSSAPAHNCVPRRDRNAAAEAIALGCKSPMVITGTMVAWPAMKTWNLDNLDAKFGSKELRVPGGSVAGGKQDGVKLHDFVAYMQRGADEDPNPRYVFESRMWPEILRDYDSTVGGIFPHDAFSVLGTTTRPPFRWLLLGPRRSGSRAHVDPYGTSAWNALVSGRKRWAFIDPEALSRGLVSKSEVEAGLKSPAHWFRDHLPALRARCPQYVGECVQEPGEVIYVPAGVWHSVLNVEDSIAVTQNFVGPMELAAACDAFSAERPCLARDWLRLLRADDGQFGPFVLDSKPRDTIITRDPPQIGVVSKLLLQRLQGLRRLDLAEVHAVDELLNGMTQHQCDSRWIAAAPVHCGQVIFVSRATMCRYNDEPHGAEQDTDQAERHMQNTWCIKPNSKVCDEQDRATSKASAPTVDAASKRVDGQALFEFTGLLRHSPEPAMSLYVICDCCIGVALRDLAAGEELTVCRSLWCFNAASYAWYLANPNGQDIPGLGGSAAQPVPDISALPASCTWPASLPSRGDALMVEALSCLGTAERALSSKNTAAQRGAALQVKQWLWYYDGFPTFKKAPYLKLRAQWLALELYVACKLLSDAWFAAVTILDILQSSRCYPLHEAPHLCTVLAEAGGQIAQSSLTHAQERAVDIFTGAGRVFCEATGGGVDMWRLWLETLLPRDVLPLARTCFATIEATPCMQPVGLGLHHGVALRVAGTSLTAARISNASSNVSFEVWPRQRRAYRLGCFFEF